MSGFEFGKKASRIVRSRADPGFVRLINFPAGESVECRLNAQAVKLFFDKTKIVCSGDPDERRSRWALLYLIERKIHQVRP